MASPLPDTDMPALYRAADQTSLDGQRSFLRATRLRLTALLFAALSGVFVGLRPAPDWVAFGAVAAFLVALMAEVHLLLSNPERAWYEGRAVAESVKTLAWKYVVGGRPFAVTDSAPEDQFIARLGEILTDLPDLTLHAEPEADEQLTPGMRALRSSNLHERRDAYRLGRIEDQRDWYKVKSGWNERRARRLRLYALCLEGAGFLAGILTITSVVRVDVLGFLAAGAAAVAAWMQTKQHETLSRAYSVAAQELAAVRSDWETSRNEEEWAGFVDEAEEAISREHTLWRASRGVRARWEN